jgi:hypothetical protein
MKKKLGLVATTNAYMYYMESCMHATYLDLESHITAAPRQAREARRTAIAAPRQTQATILVGCGAV